ncbi:MAG: hypothetical protein ACAH80_03450 [Alphaproteobacteria bacterium]
MKKTFFAALALTVALAAVAPKPAHALYVYIHNEAEYSIELPDAPLGTTIWADQDKAVPYLENPPKYGSIGEIAFLKRVDADSGDSFEVNITFLKADRDFLLSMTKEKMLTALQDLYTASPLEDMKEVFSAGTDTLKWATLTGYKVDQANALHYHTAHYLTGLDTIMIVQVQYNLENKVFQKYYETLAKSIKYVGK